MGSRPVIAIGPAGRIGLIPATRRPEKASQFHPIPARTVRIGAEGKQPAGRRAHRDARLRSALLGVGLVAQGEPATRPGEADGAADASRRGPIRRWIERRRTGG